MDNYLCVCLAQEMIAILYKLLSQGDVILYDPIMNDRKPSVVAQMRMGILLGRRTVGRPPCVAYSHDARHQVTVLRFFTQIRDPSPDLAYGYDLLIHDSDSGRIIASVFQLFQSIEQDWRSFLHANKSDYTAHKKPPKLNFSI